MLNEKIEKNIIKKTKSSKNYNYNSKSGLKQMISNIYEYLFYIIRYKIGYVSLKKGRPQTIIIIAQKRK